jgi:hypothetical protein
VPIYETNVLGGALIEMYPHQEIIVRKVFNVAELIGEIGGFVGAMQLIFGFINYLFYGNQLTKQLIQTLYRSPN